MRKGSQSFRNRLKDWSVQSKSEDVVFDGRYEFRRGGGHS